MNVKNTPTREDQERISWAGARAGAHLVRLGKWRKERGQPTHEDLSGSGILLRVGDQRGILTAAHCIRGMFTPNDDLIQNETIDVIARKHRETHVVWRTIHLAQSILEGGHDTNFEPRDSGPDIAWIPMNIEHVRFFEQFGHVFFEWREGRFPEFKGPSNSDTRKTVLYVDVVSGYSYEREMAVSNKEHHFAIEVVQYLFPLCDRWSRGGWDYEKRILDFGKPDDAEEVVFDAGMPENIRTRIPSRVDLVTGFSGGGVWRAGCDDDDRQYFDLTGIVWSQYFRDRDGVLSIVCHGKDSIRRIISMIAKMKR